MQRLNKMTEKKKQVTESAYKVNPDFIKDFKYYYKMNAGGKDAILRSTNIRDIKKKLDYVVNNNYSVFKAYYPNASKEDYKNFWAEFLKDEINHYKSLVKQYKEHI